MPSSRLDRFRSLLRADLDALPDKPKPHTIANLDGACDETNTEHSVTSYETGPSTPPLEAPETKATLGLEALEIRASPPLEAPKTKASYEAEPPTARLATTESRASYEKPIARFATPETRASSSTRSSRIPECTLVRGELVSFDQTFCPIALFSKYPYRYVPKLYSERVADACFNAGKFWERTWDLYYSWPPNESKPVILITELQAQLLIKEVNDFFEDIHLELTSEHKHELGLVLQFPDPHPHLRPRYLGRSNTREEFNDMEKNIPIRQFRPAHEPEIAPPSEEDVEAFRAWFEENAQKAKDKGKAARARKKEERLVIQRGFVKQLKRTQRYLGLRPKRPTEPLKDPTLAHLPWDDLQAAQKNWEKVVHIQPLNVTKPKPYTCDSDVVLIAIDVEAFERDQRVITEVGVSFLDVRDLDGVAPGKDGINWQSKIRTRHFWIKEHMHLRNKDFVNGCPDRFEFGTTEQVTLNEARREVAACFRPPYGVSDQSEVEKRNIILVGHDPNQDIRYLATMGSNPLDNRDNILEILDTAIIYKTWKRETQSASLGSILYDFNIVGWNLHNAGNDAHYTMQALLAIAVREAELNGTKKLEHIRQAEKEEKIEVAQQMAKEVVEDKFEGWSSQGEDGGEPEQPEGPKIVPTVGRDGTTYYATSPLGGGNGRGGGQHARRGSRARGGSVGRGGSPARELGSSKINGYGQGTCLQPAAAPFAIGSHQWPKLDYEE